uniref:Amino acid transporter transmembrane domain-containing protein n=1 Tax=Zea mays TaxID=4577 RepID=B4FG00_MAIZE|nr:unknown [Zea mays]|eukprot:NP_001132266.2 uncharacterized protein LOC100193702 [Zea mays]
MATGEQAEDAIVADVVGNGKGEEVRAMGDDAEQQRDGGKVSMKSLLWHGGSVWDAWFSCASNQVAQVLLTLPYSFSQLGMLSGVLLQVWYGLMGSWTAYLISVLYVEYRTRKEKEGVSFRNHVIQGDHARDVEASQVQVHLPAGDAVRVHADASVGGGHVLGVRRPAADALQRLLAAAEDAVARRGGGADAGPPVHHLRLRVHAALLRVGEGGGDARHPERLPPRAGPPPHRRPRLVPRHHLPLLRAHQLRRRRAPRQLHRLRHPGPRPHAHVPLRVRQIERSGEAAVLLAELVGDVRAERVRGGVDAGGWIRPRRLGQRHQLHQADRYVRALRQVLPVPDEATPRVAAAGAAASLKQRASAKG